MFKAVVFDMDGVIVDTELLYDKYRVQYLKGLGYELQEDDQILNKLRGGNSRHYWEAITEYLMMPHPIDQLIKECRVGFIEYLREQELEAIEGVKDLIERFIGEGLKLAVASSANRTRVNLTLEKVGLLGKFQEFACGDEIEKSKPYPDIYLKAAERLGIDPKDCLAIEDASNGVKAAKAAGMKVIGYDGIDLYTQDLSEADLVVKNFKELTIERVNNLFENQ